MSPPPAGARLTLAAPSPAEPNRSDAGRHGQRRRASPSLLASFAHALHGLVELAAAERNMKLHVWSGLGVCVLASEVSLPMGAQLALVVCTALVLAAEAFNSSLESLVDLHTAELREEARRVKDAAAGAVFALAAGAAIVAGVIGSHAWAEAAASLCQLRQRFPWDCGIVVMGATLLALGPERRGAKVAAALAGSGLLVHLAVRSVSLPLTAMAIGLFVLAAAAAWHAHRAGRSLREAT